MPMADRGTSPSWPTIRVSTRAKELMSRFWIATGRARRRAVDQNTGSRQRSLGSAIGARSFLIWKPTTQAVPRRDPAGDGMGYFLPAAVSSTFRSARWCSMGFH